MKKKLLCILFISFYIFIVGCTNKDVELEQIQDDIETQENINIDYNTYFESVSLEDTENFSLTRINYDGEIIDIIDSQNLLCLKNDDIISFNIDSKESRILLEDAWNCVLSNNKKMIIYENNLGVNLYNISNGNNDLIYELKDEVIRSFIISNDNKQILIQTFDEEGFIIRSITVDGKIQKIVLDEDDDYVITQLVYYNNDKLFALSEMKKDNELNESEQSRTTDMVMIDLENKHLTNLTNLTYDNKIYPLDIVDNNIFIEVVQTEINEEEVHTDRIIYKVDTSNGKLYNTYIKDFDTTVIKIYSMNYEYIYFSEPKDSNMTFPELTKIKYSNGNKEKEIASIYTDIPNEIFRYSENIYFASNNDIYVLTKTTNDFID
ncbi:MAG: hypothetical protein ACOWWH_06605 [Eubacteriaceae bacterium]